MELSSRIVIEMVKSAQEQGCQGYEVVCKNCEREAK